MNLFRRSLRRDATGAPMRHPSLRTGCTTLADAPIGRMVKIGGDIVSVILRPETTVQAVEAEVDDGSGRLAVVWLGRERIRGIEPGRGITVEGRVVRDKSVWR